MHEYPEVRKAEEEPWATSEKMGVHAANLPQGQPERAWPFEPAKAFEQPDLSSLSPEELAMLCRQQESLQRILSLREAGKISEEEMKADLLRFPES